MNRFSVWMLALVLSVAVMFPPRTLHAQTLHVAPNGSSQSDCSVNAPCSLQAAQARVRETPSHVADIVVQLDDGLYRLSEPLRFDAQDSGDRGHPIRWQAAPGAKPVIAGSRLVDGKREGGLWIFPLRPGDELSSIYVNGQRHWPASTEPCSQCKVDQKGVFNVPASIRRLLRVGSMARVHARWRDFRCRVIALGPDRVDLAQPCWHNASLDSRNDWAVASPFGKYYAGMDGFQGIDGLPSKAGTFTVDADRRVLSYRPTPSESRDDPTIEIPVAEELLRVNGTPERPVHDVSFSGLTFSFTGWREPESNDGYVSLQAGYLVTGEGRTSLPDNGEGMTRIRTAVSVQRGQRIVFDHDTFVHLAAGGLSVAEGSSDAVILNSHFQDLGGGGIFVGDTNGHPVNPADKTSHIRIENNWIDHVALAYRDNVAIMGGFVNGLDIGHNTIHDLPYTGISVGWGWNFEGEEPVESDIHIVGNRVENVMLQLADGGAIYTQGMAKPDTSYVTDNDIDMRRSGKGNGIYLDEHSNYFLVTHNVVLGSWVSAWASWSGHLRITDNWTDTPGKPENLGPTKIWAPNFTHLQTLPSAALSVVRAAGANAAKPATPMRAR
ncbi:MAG TPA: right-handed parallel beta-helix repeat-containing protein [Dyella sp.]|nr:right-handed parallel beta-helix repeat-containing protein [Dyella sp.]